MSNNQPILENSYVSPFAPDYNKLPWYERDLMAYFSYKDYKDMADNPTQYFDTKHVVNFDIIHHECRGDKSKKAYKEHNTVNEDDFKNYPNNEKKETLSGVFRNIKCDNLWMQRNHMIEHFRKMF